MDDTLIAIFKKTFALEFFPQLKFLSGSKIYYILL